MARYFSRMGGGSPISVTKDEIMADLIQGSEDAADRAKVPALSRDEYEHLLDIFCAREKFMSVEAGKEVILTYDACTLKIRRAGVNVDRIQALQIYEKLMGADTMELSHVDYSYKPIKPIAVSEQPVLEQALLGTHIPLFYGAQPNLGLYSQPDGPFPNPMELMPMGKIKEAQESYEASVEHLVKDIVYVASLMYESGADGINLDTSGAAGDADFLGALLATEELRDKYPEMCIEFGTAGEFVMGIGPVANTKTSKSSAWNMARTITFMKPVGEIANIPIHVNMGMGVGGVTMTDHPPVDIVSRSSKAMVEICRLDGL